MWGNTGWKLNSILLGTTKPKVFQGSVTFSRPKLAIANWLKVKYLGKIGGTFDNFDRGSDQMMV
mgnify:CR=1 FL=1